MRRVAPSGPTWDQWDIPAEVPPRSYARFLPDFGQKVAVRVARHHDRGVPDHALVSHVVATTSLSASEAARVIDDVIAFYAQPVEVYVRERHAHLKAYGAKNPEIFARVAAELADRVVAAPELSERQLRRMIYG